MGYSVRAGYDASSRLIPLATKPPPVPIVQRQPRKRPQPEPQSQAPRRSARAASSPYSVTPGYSGGLIPASTPPPNRTAQTKVPAPHRAHQRGAPHAAPPRHMQQVARIPSSIHGMQTWQPEPSAPAWVEPEQNLEPPPPPLRLLLNPDAPFCADGLIPDAPAIYFDSRLSGLTSSTSYILSELLEDPSSEVTLSHDAEWEEFPDVGEALRVVGGEETAMCIAFCSSVGVWGVGLGGKWQKRENIAKLALCVALVQNHENAQAVFEQFPEFAEYCEVQKPSRKKQRKSKPVPKAPAKVVKAAKPIQQMHPAGNMESDCFPKDVPIWIKITTDDMPAHLDGLLPEALAVSTDGTKRKALYSKADEVLEAILPDFNSEIEFHDDADWKMFPEVGAALKEVAAKEECMCVAVCHSRSTWAVGVGMKGTPRWLAAKVAIAAALLWQASSMGEEPPELGSQAMLDFLEEVQQARESIGW